MRWNEAAAGVAGGAGRVVQPCITREASSKRIGPFVCIALLRGELLERWCNEPSEVIRARSAKKVLPASADILYFLNRAKARMLSALTGSFSRGPQLSGGFAQQVENGPVNFFDAQTAAG